MSTNLNYPKKIALVGAGNVATTLGLELKTKEYKIIQVYSRTKKSASKLARQLNTSFTTQLSKISSEADLIIISVKDEALEEIIKQIPHKKTFIVHTSGSIGIDVFKKQFEKYGVLYPLQTFSKSRKVNFQHVPLLIEANSKNNVTILKKFANSISSQTYIVDSKKRKAIHVAAVFTCNFTNHLFTIAEEIVQKEKLSFKLLQPLIEETISKIKENSPKAMQTGPAIRNDKKILKEHLQYLYQYPEIYQKIYKLISESINKTYKINKE